MGVFKVLHLRCRRQRFVKPASQEGNTNPGTVPPDPARALAAAGRSNASPGLRRQHHPTRLRRLFFCKVPTERKRTQILGCRFGSGSRPPHSWPCLSWLQPQPISRPPSLLNTYFFSGLLKLNAANLLRRKLCILLVLLCQL